MRTRRLLAGIVAALLLTSSARAAPLQIVGVDIPPFNYLKSERAEGFCVDVVREVQRRIRDTAEIQVQPLARMMARAKTEPDIMLMCLNRTEDREDKFEWVAPLFSSSTNIYVRADSPLRTATRDELKALPGVLVLRASYAYDTLQAQGFTNLAPIPGIGTTPLKMLMAGREPALMLEERHLGALLQQAGLPPDSVRPVYRALVAETYVAFSRGTSEARIRQWRRALEDVRRDGTLGRLYRQRFGEPLPARGPEGSHWARAAKRSAGTGLHLKTG